MTASALKRPHFFSGRLITAEDLDLEQKYFREKLKRHNRSLHGFGIVTGLGVTSTAAAILVDPGMALDCEGNELVVETQQTLSVEPALTSTTVYLSVGYFEECETLISSAGTNNADFIRENCLLEVTPDNCNRGHRHLRARWLACGSPHPLTLAKLRRGAGGWRVDRGYRPPQIK